MPCASSEHLPKIPSLSTISNISPPVHSGHDDTKIPIFKKQNKKFTILLPTPRLPLTTLYKSFLSPTCRRKAESVCARLSLKLPTYQLTDDFPRCSVPRSANQWRPNCQSLCTPALYSPQREAGWSAPPSRIASSPACTVQAGLLLPLVFSSVSSSPSVSEAFGPRKEGHQELRGRNISCPN